MRRAHDGIKFTAAVEICDNCGELKLRHRLCEACGVYRGRQVVRVAAEFE
jgi:large subunit ribosomal protein L32